MLRKNKIYTSIYTCMLRSTNIYCLVNSLKIKEKQVINNQFQKIENQIEKIKDKVTNNESSKDITDNLINELTNNLSNLKKEMKQLELNNSQSNKCFNIDLTILKNSLKIISKSFEDKIIKSNENNTRQLLFNEENTMSIIRILEEKLLNLENKKNLIESIGIDEIIKLKIYPKTTSILVSTNTNKPFEYFYENNKLYQNNNFGTDSNLVNGYYFIAISNNDQIVNRAWNVQNGELLELTNYFDGSNSKLIIDSTEYLSDGSIILTSDFKLWIRINNCWISK